MITNFDDYCIHQIAEPVAQPSQSDRNFYDRYWFNGFDHDGRFIFEAALGLYPNRHVMDAHFSVAVGKRQHAFHASRRAPMERGETVVGPLAVEIVRPMRITRVRLEPNDSGISCDLTFTARTIPTEEPRSYLYDDGHVILHTCRFTQYGMWEGHFVVDGQRTEVRRATTFGLRDKSWGVRPVGEPQIGAPGRLTTEPGVYWVWCPVHFDAFCTHFATFENRDGHPTQLGAAIVPAYANLDAIPAIEEPGLKEMQTARHKVHWEKGTRRATGVELELVPPVGEPLRIVGESIARFQMFGIGYQHPEWGHAFWKGELATGSEHFDHDELDPLEFKNIHVHQIVRARLGDQEGIGTLETVVIGRHAPSRFRDFFDGAP
jgi:hypothetical protein